jgi:hypothetical protein
MKFNMKIVTFSASAVFFVYSSPQSLREIAIRNGRWGWTPRKNTWVTSMKTRLVQVFRFQSADDFLIHPADVSLHQFPDKYID